MKNPFFEIEQYQCFDTRFVSESIVKSDCPHNNTLYYENLQNTEWLMHILNRLNKGEATTIVQKNWPFKKLWESFYLKNQIEIEQSRSLFLASSGVSGRPKLIQIKPEILARRLDQYRYFYGEHVRNVLCFLPLSFGHGLIANVLGPLTLGKKVYINPTLDLNFLTEFKNLLHELEIDSFSCVPSHIRMLKKVYQKNISQKKLEIHCASSPLMSSDFNFLKELFPNAVLKFHFGMTEMCSWISMKEYDLLKDNFIVHCVGRLIQLKTELNQESEILIKLDHEMRTIDLISQNWNVFEKDQSFNTKDCGEIKNNELYVLGRNSDFINKAGLKISPFVIEETLKKKWSHYDFYAIGVESESYNEEIYLVCQPEFQSEHKQYTPAPNLLDVSQYLRLELGSEYVPKYLKVVNDINLNSNGKVSRLMLKNSLKAKKIE